MAKADGKWVGMLLIFFGLFLNPFVLGRLFSHNGSIESNVFLTLIIGVEILILILGIVILKSQNRLIQNLGLSVLSVVLAITATISADRIYGRFIMPETANILFPAFSRAAHYTSEFKLDVRINNLGFRGANTTVKKTRKRVLIIGDSFTFGWGVEEDETWIHLLSEKHPNVEFLNLGQGGNHPGDFVQIAKKAIPLLQPDLVMVAILQGNDIHQLMRVIEFEESGTEINSRSQGKEPPRETTRRYLKTFYPNLVNRFPTKVSIQEAWLKDAEALLSSLNDELKTKYQKLDENVRKQFEDGRLNPSLIYESLHHPNMFRVSVDTNNLLCKKAILRMHDHVVELQKIATENSAELMVISLPNQPYGFSNSLRPLQELGFDVTGCDTLDANIPFHSAMLGIPAQHINPTLETSTERLFYNYDGHWITTGNRTFAHALTAQLDTLPEWKHFLTSSNF